MQVKRTAREDQVARITRTIRDRAYRASGYNANDPEYRAIVWALAQVRDEFRANS
jgi:hypothetical protein